MERQQGRYIIADTISGREIVTLCRRISEDPGCIERFRVPQCHAPLRLWYGREEDVCTIIDVSPPQRRVKIYNYTKDLLCRVFGKKEEPTYEQYEAFLKSRCFPKSRNKMKLILEELGLPFYDPLMIIEKTEGRMADVKISVSVCVIFALRPG